MIVGCTLIVGARKHNDAIKTRGPEEAVFWPERFLIEFLCAANSTDASQYMDD